MIGLKNHLKIILRRQTPQPVPGQIDPEPEERFIHHIVFHQDDLLKKCCNLLVIDLFRRRIIGYLVELLDDLTFYVRQIHELEFQGSFLEPCELVVGNQLQPMLGERDGQGAVMKIGESQQDTDLHLQSGHVGGVPGRLLIVEAPCPFGVQVNHVCQESDLIFDQLLIDFTGSKIVIEMTQGAL